MLPRTEITCLKHDTLMFDKTRSNDSNIWIMLHPCFEKQDNVSNILNHVTCLFEIQDPILEIV
jgi:hypothetical protein